MNLPHHKRKLYYRLVVEQMRADFGNPEETGEYDYSDEEVYTN